MTDKILKIARHTFAENIKHRNFAILAVFLAAVLGSGFLFSMLAPQQEVRVILDLGTAAIEMFAFLAAAFLSVRIILQEMEQKTVYLILSRPVSRCEYIAGRYLGILSVTGAYILIMTAALAGMLLLKGWQWDIFLAGIALSIFMKVLIVISVAILLSLVSTSPATSFISTFFIWGIGHFTGELRYLSLALKESGSVAAAVLDAAYYLIPDFSRLNYKDFFHAREVFTADFFWAGGYAIFYALAVLTAAVIVFDSKEL